MNIPLKPTTFRLWAILFLLLFTICYGYYSQISSKQEQTILIETYAVQPHQDGFQAHIDPDTGRFAPPTEAQKKAFKEQAQQRQAKQPAARVYKKQLPDGTKILDLEERYSPGRQ